MTRMMNNLWTRFERWRSKMIFRIGIWWCGESDEVEHPVDQYAAPKRKKPKLTLKRKS